MAAPGSGVAAYISARLCEPAPAASAAPSAHHVSTDHVEGDFLRADVRKPGVGTSQADQLQFGGNVDFATNSVGFGLGIRASRGMPVLVLRNLGALATFDFFFGAGAPSAAGEADVSGHSLSVVLLPVRRLRVREV